MICFCKHSTECFSLFCFADFPFETGAKRSEDSAEDPLFYKSFQICNGVTLEDMDFNKDEAKRAMDIAETMITQKDYSGAKKFANKAQNLFPELDGLKQLLITINIYIAGEKKICGEADWYGVLNVTPFTDDDEMKKQWRKLVLMVHPDKNKCKGAEGAFMLVSEAWSLLSDKCKRDSYNMRRQVEEAPQRSPATQSGIQPHQPTSNGFQNVEEPVVSSARGRGTGTGTSTGRGRGRGRATAGMDRSRMGSSAFGSSMQEESTAFWTKCNKCNTQYEYPRVYLNLTLHCLNCSSGFKAEEKTPPENVPQPVNLSANQQHSMSTTFWTKCNKCNNQYEYPRVYLNKTLLCPNCRSGFEAEEKTRPENCPQVFL